MQPLTEAQQELYDWLVTYINEQNQSPTYRLMTKVMGLKSIASIQERLRQLKRKGYIDWSSGKAKSIRLLINPIETVQICSKASALLDSLVEGKETRTSVVERAIALYYEFAELSPVPEGDEAPPPHDDPDDLCKTFMGMDDNEELPPLVYVAPEATAS